LLGDLVSEVNGESVQIIVESSTNRSELDHAFERLGRIRNVAQQRTWLDNIESYLRFGDLGPKSVHPGSNLRGDEQELVSDYLVWRKYRFSMMVLARGFVEEMSRATDPVSGPLRRGENDSKPGVYSLYILGGVLGIGVYNLVLDKVYSDYGGIPMAHAPGSRMETGIEPVADAGPALRTGSDLAQAFFLRE
jgi:hypothetical protein